MSIERKLLLNTAKRARDFLKTIYELLDKNPDNLSLNDSSSSSDNNDGKDEHGHTKKGHSSYSCKHDKHHHSTSSKQVRDPNAPKKPLNAFMLFMQKRRGELLASGANKADAQYQVKAIGVEWSQLPEKDKQVWLDLAKTAKSKYDTELQQYEDKKHGGVAKKIITEETKCLSPPRKEEIMKADKKDVKCVAGEANEGKEKKEVLKENKGGEIEIKK